jgi:hypothetical protein
MLFIGDRYSGRFIKMIVPYSVDCSTSNQCVLYVQDCNGLFYTLTFESHEVLSEAMKNLYNHGRAVAKCDCEIYREPEKHSNNDYDREIDCFELDDIDMEIDR